MAYVLQNSIIYNEALAAYIFVRGNSVASSGTPPATSADDPDGSAYTGTALLEQAIAFAQAVDTAIVTDRSISDGSGLALAPISQAIQSNQLGKSAAVRGCCLAFLCPGGSWLNWMPGGPIIAPATGRGVTKLGGDHSGGNLKWLATVGYQILTLYTATQLAMQFAPAD